MYKKFVIGMIAGVLIGYFTVSMVSCESTDRVSGTDLREGTQATLDLMEKQIESLQTAYDLAQTDEQRENVQAQIDTTNELRKDTAELARVLDVVVDADTGDINWEMALPLIKDVLPEEYRQLLAIDESGGIDTMQTVTNTSMLLPQPWGSVLTLGFGLAGIGIQEYRKRKKESTLAEAVQEQQELAAEADRRTKEVIASVDAMRRASETLNDEINTKKVKEAAWDQLSPDTFNMIQENSNVA